MAMPETASDKFGRQLALHDFKGLPENPLICGMLALDHSNHSNGECGLAADHPVHHKGAVIASYAPRDAEERRHRAIRTAGDALGPGATPAALIEAANWILGVENATESTS